MRMSIGTLQTMRCQMVIIANEEDKWLCAQAIEASNYLETVLYDMVNPTVNDMFEVLLQACVFFNTDKLKYNYELDEIRAIGWLTDIKGKTAWVHFSTLKTISPTDNIRLVEETLRKMEEVCDLKAIYGLTPKCYRHTLSYIKKVGFNELHVSPEACYIARKNKLYDGVVTVRMQGG